MIKDCYDDDEFSTEMKKPTKKTIERCINFTINLLTELKKNDTIMDYFLRITDPQNYIPDKDFQNKMTNECSKFCAWLKVPFIIGIKEVHAIAISFHYYPFNGDILIIRSYLGTDGDVIDDEEHFEKNVSLEILFADVFQIKSKAECLEALNQLSELIAENSYRIAYFQPNESSIIPEDTSFNLQFKSPKKLLNGKEAHSISFFIPPYHLKIFIDICFMVKGVRYFYGRFEFNHFDSQNKISEHLENILNE